MTTEIAAEGSHRIVTAALLAESFFVRSETEKGIAEALSACIVRARSTRKITFMSQHRSLKGQSTIAAKRNVLKRFERVELLTKRGQFKKGDKVIGLRKTKPDA